MLARLVPDVRDREVFVCGQPLMMQAVIATLHAFLEYSSARFSLHDRHDRRGSPG